MRRWYIDSDSIKMIPRLHLFWVNAPQDIKGAIPSRKCPIMSSAAMKKVLNETLQYTIANCFFFFVSLILYSYLSWKSIFFQIRNKIGSRSWSGHGIIPKFTVSFSYLNRKSPWFPSLVTSSKTHLHPHK